MYYHQYTYLDLPTMQHVCHNLAGLIDVNLGRLVFHLVGRSQVCEDLAKGGRFGGSRWGRRGQTPADCGWIKCPMD